ncbi:MAG TPA: lasso peptide biosynthesis B2 protein [Pyrinomonadaceae bacterium]|nr:lasso peptide biosynthesis B2 protein [Pyrinomonadaceae bacterium]
MLSPGSSTQRQRVGSLLLWEEGSAMFTLNSTANLVWKVLEASSNGLTVEKITDYLESECGPTNAVSRQEMEHDIEELLKGLSKRGLIVTRATKSGPIYQIRKGILRVEDGQSTGMSDSRFNSVLPGPLPLHKTLHDLKLILTPALSDRTLGVTALEQLGEINRYQSVIYTFIGFLSFAVYDVMLKTVGLNRVTKIIKRWPTKKTHTMNETKLKRTCAGIERARIWYPKKVMCMQHSAVVCLLLRRQGLCAQFVIGGRQMPFKSHAWAEVLGSVLNDNQKVQHTYKIFTRY